MLTLIAFSVALMQQTPAPGAPEVHTRFVFVGSESFAGLDGDGDGYITREEFISPLNDRFTRLDRDGDGRLSAEELAVEGEALAGDGDNIILMRRTGALDGAGVRLFEHRREGAQTGAPVGHGDARTRVFIGGGPGEGGEREIVIREGPGARVASFSGSYAEGGSGERVWIRRLTGPGGRNDLDADQDGRISEAEFVAPIRGNFARLDADGSGFIEAGERGTEIVVHRIETRAAGED